MKNASLIGVVFFVLALLSKDITAVGWQIWYRVNLEYVAKNLCENREKPVMKCNGKCYLAKQLAKAEGEKVQKEKQKLPVLKLKTVEGILFQESRQTLFSDAGALKQKQTFRYSTLLSDPGTQAIDHPPTV